MSVSLSIIIVNYNSKSVLQNCLTSIINSNFLFSYEVFVIDNASSEQINDLENEYCGFKFIFNPVNSGFAAANNIGIRQAVGKYILLLNPDTIVNKDSFDPMIQYLERNGDAGVVGCKIFNNEGIIERSTHSFPTLLKEFVHANEFIKLLISYESGFAGFFKKIFKSKSLESYWDHNEIREVDHVTGACMMVKKEVIEKTGLLDEAFFLYNEEVEWSLRIKKAGYKIVFLPNSNIIHLFGHSTQQKVQKQTVNHLLVERYRGMFYFFQKHFGKFKLFLLRLIVFEGFLLRIISCYIKILYLKKENYNIRNKELHSLKEILQLCFMNNFDWRVR